MMRTVDSNVHEYKGSRCVPIRPQGYPIQRPCSEGEPFQTFIFQDFLFAFQVSQLYNLIHDFPFFASLPYY